MLPKARRWIFRASAWPATLLCGIAIGAWFHWQSPTALDNPDISLFWSNLLSGFIGAVVGALVSFGVARYAHSLDVKHEQRREVAARRSWLVGLNADLQNIVDDIELARQDTANRRVNEPSLKRLTPGFLEAAILAWREFNEEADFFQLLSRAYANVVHTNKMLDAFASISGVQERVEASKQPVLSSLSTTFQSIQALQLLVTKKIISLVTNLR